MPGPVIRPVQVLPEWVKPENASVLDPAYRAPVRAIVKWLGLDDPTQIVGLAGTIDAGPVVGGVTAAVAKRFPRLAKTIQAFHGSPHDFDQFDTAKIGTGEGAHAYGHGLYFAEKEGVAKQYRDSLAHDALLTAEGQRIVPPAGTVDDMALAWLKSNDVPGVNPYQEARRQLRTETTLKHKQAIIDRLHEWEAAGHTPSNSGKMYEVAIKADPDAFLDWDKPIQQQPDAVRKLAGYTKGTEAAGKVLDRKAEELMARQQEIINRPGALSERGHLRPGPDREEYNRVTLALSAISDKRRELYGRAGQMGEEIYRGLGPQAAATEKLKQAGIPGIKYLDQGSRSAGEGSRNFVVFDAATIEILRKYGLLLPAAGAGGSAAMQEPTR